MLRAMFARRRLFQLSLLHSARSPRSPRSPRSSGASASSVDRRGARRRVAAALALSLLAACDSRGGARYGDFVTAGSEPARSRDGAERRARASDDGDAAIVWPPLDEAFLAASAATLRFRLGAPTPLAITADGAVLFRRTAARERIADLYQLPAGAADAAVLASAASLLSGGAEKLSDEEKARRERTRTSTGGVVDISLSEDGQRVLVPVGERLFLVERATGAARELVVGPGFPLDPQLSPDGQKLVFQRDGDLWVMALGGGAATRLTRHPAGQEYGVAEFVAQEELERTRGTWWAPDGKLLLFQRTDASAVETLYVSDARHPERAPVPFKYPRPGKANAKVDLGLIAPGGGAPRWISWDLARYPYLSQVKWPKRGPLTLIVLNRDQTEVAALAVDLVTGATRVLRSERDAAWVNAPPDLLTWLDDGSGFLWRTEEPGSWALDLYDPAGAFVRHVVLPDLGLRKVVAVSPDGKELIVEAATDPREQHVWRVPLAGGDAQPLTAVAEGGVHRAMAKHGVVVIRSELRAGGSRVEVLRADGSRAELPSVAERPALVPTTQFANFSVDGHMQYASITRPRAFEKGRTYPVLLSVYGGPHVKTVLDARDTYLMDQWYADAGFIVVRTDGRGTPDRGREYERAIAKDLLTLPMNDQMGALRRLARKNPELDLSRVGVFGWSFGGYMATMATLLHPEMFAAGVAGAPVTDWELYDTAYTERYMKLPADNAEGYRRTSALTYPDKLERPLLIIHGITDDNVHFAHTLALIEALYTAGKRAEVVTLSATHMVPDPKLVYAREKVQVDFFREHLARPVPEIAARLEEERREILEDRRRRFGDKAGTGSDADLEGEDD
jgi:dipeptidyl-peptidase 4